MVMELYRKLVIKSVRKREKDLSVDFYDSLIEFRIDYAFLKEHYIDHEDIVSGRSILIKGTSGNDDALLARPRPLEDIILVPIRSSERKA